MLCNHPVKQDRTRYGCLAEAELKQLGALRELRAVTAILANRYACPNSTNKLRGIDCAIDLVRTRYEAALAAQEAIQSYLDALELEEA